MGYAVWSLRQRRFVLHGTVSTTPEVGRRYVSEDNSRRCRVLASAIRTIAFDYSVKLAVAELPSGGAKSSSAATAMAMAASIVSVSCHLLNIPLVVTTPGESKRVVSAKGSVSKQQVQEWVENNFEVTLPDVSEIREHVADAMMALEVCRRNRPEGKLIRYGNKG